jgi:hypothetical protein
VVFDRDAYDVAWNWFRVHADQRLDLFKSYLTWIIALTAGYVSLLQLGAFEAAIMVGILGITVGWVFKKLDERAAALLKLAEKALKKEEAKLAERSGNAEIELIARAEIPAHDHWTYRKSFNVLFVGTSILFGIGCLYALKRLAS